MRCNRTRRTCPIPTDDDNDDIISEPLPDLDDGPDLEKMLIQPSEVSIEDMTRLVVMMTAHERTTIAMAIVAGAVSAAAKRKDPDGHKKWREACGLAESTDYLARKLYSRWVSLRTEPTVPYPVGIHTIPIPVSMANRPLKEAAFGDKPPPDDPPTPEQVGINLRTAWAGANKAAGEVAVDNDHRLSPAAFKKALSNHHAQKAGLDTMTVPKTAELLSIALDACHDRGEWGVVDRYTREVMEAMAAHRSDLPPEYRGAPPQVTETDRPRRFGTPEAARAAWELSYDPMQEGTAKQKKQVKKWTRKERDGVIRDIIDTAGYPMTSSSIASQAERATGVSTAEMLVTRILNKAKHPRWSIDDRYWMPGQWMGNGYPEVHPDAQREIAAEHGWQAPKNSGATWSRKGRAIKLSSEAEKKRIMADDAALASISPEGAAPKDVPTASRNRLMKRNSIHLRDGRYYRGPDPVDVCEAIMEALRDLGKPASAARLVPAVRAAGYAVVTSDVETHLRGLAEAGAVVEVEEGLWGVAGRVA